LTIKVDVIENSNNSVSWKELLETTHHKRSLIVDKIERLCAGCIGNKTEQVCIDSNRVK
jgi:hypothetical protein